MNWEIIFEEVSSYAWQIQQQQQPAKNMPFRHLLAKEFIMDHHGRLFQKNTWKQKKRSDPTVRGILFQTYHRKRPHLLRDSNLMLNKMLLVIAGLFCGIYLQVKLMAQIPKGRLVKGPYKPICRDCNLLFNYCNLIVRFLMFWGLRSVCCWLKRFLCCGVDICWDNNARPLAKGSAVNSFRGDPSESFAGHGQRAQGDWV